VNLLEDHLVDLLLDVAASGENVVEREGLSVRHPARFVLIGSGNPEEGELRPQLLDRFGLSLWRSARRPIADRIEVVRAARPSSATGPVRRPLAARGHEGIVAGASPPCASAGRGSRCPTRR
jgi:Mg-chelatase subunit ChlI